MLSRFLVALVGGIVITVAILLGMTEITKRFRDRDPTRYFRITDVIPAPDGRRW